jgi:dihydroorotase
MEGYVRREAASFGRALVMPNTLPPVAGAASLADYRDRILAALPVSEGPAFTPLMAFKLLPGMSAATVRACARAGAVAGKYSPAGATTNSADGIHSPTTIEEALGAMEAEGLVLSIHGEDPEAPSLGREEAFLPVVASILEGHPSLRVVFEHVSSAAGLAFVLGGPKRLAASLTAHHLLLCLDDLLGEALDPHLFCKPVLKPARDREALREAVFRGEAKLFFGSDSAPHPRAAKEGRRAPAGIYSSPTALPALAALFAEAGALDQLRPFLCARGAAFYHLPPPQGRLVLSEEAWTVPDELDGSVPLLAGKKLSWRVAERSN